MCVKEIERGKERERERETEIEKVCVDVTEIYRVGVLVWVDMKETEIKGEKEIMCMFVCC